MRFGVVSDYGRRTIGITPQPPAASPKRAGEPISHADAPAAGPQIAFDRAPPRPLDWQAQIATASPDAYCLQLIA
jgi:hypothetical protein